MHKKTILLLSNFFSPNIGGVETHLDDLVSFLANHNYFVYVLTYQPLTTNTKAAPIERNNNIFIRRLPWISGDYFFQLKDNPFFEFLYLFPFLFIYSVFFLMKRKKEIDVIHAHGIIVGVTGILLKKFFSKKTIISFHSIYHFPKKGLYRQFAKWLCNNADHILTLSEQSKKEIVSLGIAEKKVSTFTYWINQKVFSGGNKEQAKRLLRLQNLFIVLFVGRLIPEKGIPILLEAVKDWPEQTRLLIVGAGPLEEFIKERGQIEKKIIYIGSIKQKKLPEYLHASDFLIVPSTHEEGFGRVILEALSCGIPVVAARRGGIKEAMDTSVGEFIDITPEKITQTVQYFVAHSQELTQKAKQAKIYAQKKYSDDNAFAIVKQYE